MRLRFLTCLLCLTLLATPALAQTNEPTRAIYCRGIERLQDALSQGRAVQWTLTMDPEETDLLSGGARILLSALSLGGLTWAGESGGTLSLALQTDGETVLRLQQKTADGLTGLNVDGTWFAADAALTAQDAQSLPFGTLGALLLLFDYDALREGEIPYLTPVYDSGETLWRLASPYVWDNDRLSTGSGQTSHALTYQIDTQGFREIADEFATWLEESHLFLPGISQQSVDAFIEKVRVLAQSAVVSQDLKANVTFGEGDLMRTAKMSGTVQTNGHSAGVSYTYSCGVSNTRLTRKYSLRYEPSQGDTVSLSATYLTSCSGNGGAAQQLSVSASGEYDGQPYSIRLQSDITNRYSLDEKDALEEALTGELSAKVQYAGETVLEGSFALDSSLFSTSDAQTLSWNGTLMGDVQSREILLFDGTLAFTLDVLDEGEPPAFALNEVVRVDGGDESILENARTAFGNVWESAVKRIAFLLPNALQYEISITE